MRNILEGTIIFSNYIMWCLDLGGHRCSPMFDSLAISVRKFSNVPVWEFALDIEHEEARSSGRVKSRIHILEGLTVVPDGGWTGLCRSAASSDINSVARGGKGAIFFTCMFLLLVLGIPSFVSPGGGQPSTRCIGWAAIPLDTFLTRMVAYTFDSFDVVANRSRSAHSRRYRNETPTREPMVHCIRARLLKSAVLCGECHAVAMSAPCHTRCTCRCCLSL